MKSNRLAGLAVSLGATVVFVAYAPGGADPARLTSGASAAPVPTSIGFPTCQAMARQLRQLSAARIGEVLEAGVWYQGPYGAVRGGDSMLSGSGLSGPAPPPVRLPTVGTEPTGTNVAERSVDEPDIAKVDGTRVLRLWGNEDPPDGDDPLRHTVLNAWELAVVDARGDVPRKLGALRPGGAAGAIEMLLLDDHRVLVVGTAAEGSTRAGDDELWTPKVVLTLVDTSDAGRPEVLRIVKLTGRYVSARLHDGVARVVFATPAPLRVSPPGVGESDAAATARNLAALRRHADDNWLPVREVLDAAGRPMGTGPAMDCQAVHPSPAASSPDLLSVLTFDTRGGPAALDTAPVRAVVGGADLVYASPGRVYVASHRWGRQDGGDDAVTIHAFDTTGRADSPYAGAGTVPGRLLGSSALSEYDGHLRVAVTTEDGRGSDNGIAVLAHDHGRLRPVGRLTGLGPGEEIRSVRWSGPYATVVTFRRTDPFYALDLSRPADPGLLGELKVPGYSGYLHPVGGRIVLGVGQSGDEWGNLSGLQVSAFDLTDPRRPVRTDTLDLGVGRADAEADPRAFTYLPGRRTAVVVGDASDESRPDAEAVAVSVEPGGRLRETGWFPSRTQVLRVLPVGDRLAAVTGDGITLLDPAGLRPTGILVLAPGQHGYPPGGTRPRRPGPTGWEWVD